MLDRVSVNPGRVLVTPENGGAAYYATLTRADNPTQEGTPLNKASLLKDATAALFGLGQNAVPDDVLAAIKNLIEANTTLVKTKAKIATGSYTGTGTYGSNNKNSLTLDFTPKLVIIIEDTASQDSYVSGVFIRPSSVDAFGANSSGDSADYAYNNLIWTDNGVSWYTNATNTGVAMYPSRIQLNKSGKTYRYVAIG